jgi:hypothetical protein
MGFNLSVDINNDEHQHEMRKIIIERILNSKISSAGVEQGIMDVWDEENNRMGKGYSGETFLKATLVDVQEDKPEKESPKEKLISDEEIDRVHGNANFGTLGKRDVIDQGVLKCACGYFMGSTSTKILEDHGLVTKNYELTPKGKMYLWAAFSKKHTV